MIQFLDQRRKKDKDNTDFEEKRRLVQGDGNVLSELGTSIHTVRVRVRSKSFVRVRAFPWVVQFLIDGR